MRYRRAAGWAVVLAAASVPASAARIAVYISPPAAMASSIAGVTTETFNAPLTGLKTSDFVGAIGTFHFTPTSAGMVQLADQFGGASRSQYMAFGAQSSTTGPVTIDLVGQETYYGFWWSAGDVNNGVTFYNGNTAQAHFSSATLMSFLSPKATGTVTAINGTRYNDSAYYGNPNSGTYAGQNANEPYVYVHFVATGLTFNRIVLDNGGQQGTGFESDNHSIYNGTVTVPGTYVYLGEAIPEPGTWLTAATALTGLLVWRRRRVGPKMR